MGDFGDDPEGDDTALLAVIAGDVDLIELAASDPLPPVLTDAAPEPFEGGGS